jgi:CDP-diacylglycerol--glycerol-3-phosphate 3-phosphatidyltransferase
MITPNKITTYRIILTGLLMIGFYVFYQDVPLWMKMGFGAVWFLIVLMDSLDGYIARGRNLQSTYGVYLDYTADSICMFAFYFFMVEVDILPLWFVSLLLTREFLVTFIFRLAMVNKSTIGSSSLGKQQVDLIGFLLVGVYWFQTLGGTGDNLWIFVPIVGLLFFWGNIVGYSDRSSTRIISILFLLAAVYFDSVVDVFITMALLLTTATLTNYLWQARSYIFDPKQFD